MQQNLQLVVQVAKEYTEQLGADKIIDLLEGVKSYHGLYYYLGSYLAFSEDPEVGFEALNPGHVLGPFNRTPSTINPGLSSVSTRSCTTASIAFFEDLLPPPRTCSWGFRPEFLPPFRS